MKNVYCQEVIISNLLMRGKGVIGDPVRLILQVYDKEGNLIAENDPDPSLFTKELMIEFVKWCVQQTDIAISKNTPITYEQSLQSWLESKLPF